MTRRIIIAGLLLIVTPVAAQVYVPWYSPYPQYRYAPRAIYNHGQYYFCTTDDPTPECDMPNDYSAALHPYRGPPDPVRETHPPKPKLIAPAPPALASNSKEDMDQEREAIIRQGEAHCRKYPQDTKVCHLKQ